MLVLDTAATVAGAATDSSEVTYTLSGSEVVSGVASYKVLAQGQLAATPATIYTVPASTATQVSHILLANTNTVPETVALFVNGTGAANQVMAMVIPAGGSATFDRDGWKVYDATGSLQTVSATAGTAGGDLQGSYPDPSVGGFLNVPLTATSPSDGDVYVYDGSGPIWDLIKGVPTDTGSGCPEDTQTGVAGDTYLDTTYGGLWGKTYGSTGDTGWIGGAPGNISTFGGSPVPAGYMASNTDPLTGTQLVEICGAAGFTWITDVIAYGGSGSSDGIYYNCTGTDGQQSVFFILGLSPQYTWTFSPDGTTQLPDVPDTGNSQTSGALPTQSFVSGTGAQVDTTHDRQVVVSTTTAGTVLAELSTDGTTYSTLFTKTVAVSDEVTVTVRARWYLRLTATAATLGTATVY